MRSFKKLGVLIAVFALCAIGAANASAAEFTSTVEGALEVKSNETQVFTTNGGEVRCNKVVVTGKAVLKGTSQHATAHYSGCTAVNHTAHISPATYLFTSNGQVHIQNTITITVTTIFQTCHITITPQIVGAVTYIDNSNGTITLTPHVKGIKYHASEFCGSSGTNGTYTGNSTIGVSGGLLKFDP